MEYVSLGKTGLLVSRTSFGALPIQRVQNYEEATRIIRRAYDGGINFFDSARLYSDSEKKLGFALNDVRSNVIIASKTMSRTKEAILKAVGEYVKSITDAISECKVKDILGEDTCNADPMLKILGDATLDGDSISGAIDKLKLVDFVGEETMFTSKEIYIEDASDLEYFVAEYGHVYADNKLENEIIDDNEVKHSVLNIIGEVVDTNKKITQGKLNITTTGNLTADINDLNISNIT